jgi:hypothetical protein
LFVKFKSTKSLSPQDRQVAAHQAWVEEAHLLAGPAHHPLVGLVDRQGQADRPELEVHPEVEDLHLVGPAHRPPGGLEVRQVPGVPQVVLREGEGVHQEEEVVPRALEDHQVPEDHPAQGARLERVREDLRAGLHHPQSPQRRLAS